MSKLINILNELGDSKQAEIMVKKVVVEHFQSEKRSKRETLKLLNEVLEEWGKEPATISCVKHYWK
ncbi:MULTISPECIES: hypothetical protein [Bacillus cereus group]|uniref:hypothetical protein n=1 Tax=Bacillus cereus group TaxID=86661 RepID=UPI000BF780CF|nr:MULTISPECIES: hypothetical protein [Bacillus cereus group]MBE4939679.1 hypothetical protein [Bacillus thuringiensis]PFC37691.1 hypothetical protein CN310_13940 [Bacillus cereus]PFQ72984.1 hypothetical protein COK15_26020 [Bacillus cereus]PFU08920.1 hypothetical protein COK79_24920 [Bacillus cereus]PGY73715.1 hypothetical protein COE34_03145 [Bacillus cereus]